MRIVVSGATGLMGSALVPSLRSAGHTVLRLTRSRQDAGADEIWWDPANGVLDPAALEGVDAVVHLSGESIATGRWTQDKKARILNSRVNSTRLLGDALIALTRPPQAWICASATGFYGSRGDEVLGEDSAAGTGFLSEVCQAWEAATAPAADKGIRVINLRFGVVLSRAGGALQQMLTPFKLGLGGVFGNGAQFMSWIAVDDVPGVVQHLLATESLRGPVNAVAPSPVTNRAFTEALGKVLSRPTLFRMPAFAARLAMGEMADALLLASARAVPKRLTDSGYAFAYPELEGALRHLLT